MEVKNVKGHNLQNYRDENVGEKEKNRNAKLRMELLQ